MAGGESRAVLDHLATATAAVHHWQQVLSTPEPALIGGELREQLRRDLDRAYEALCVASRAMDGTGPAGSGAG